MDYGVDIIPVQTYNIIIIIRCQLESKEETDMQNEQVRLAAKEAGIPLAVLVEIYNHASLSVTRRYLGIAQDDLDSAYRSVGEAFSGKK